MPSFKKIGEVSEIELPDGEKISGKFIEYSGDHATSAKTKGRLFVAR